MAKQYPREIAATHRLRDAFPQEPQRRLARRIAEGITRFPGPENYKFHGDVERARGNGTAPEATIYGRIRRYDKRHGVNPRSNADEPTHPTFRPGDRVRVREQGRRYNDTPGYRALWMAPMDAFVGREFTVANQDEYGVGVEENAHAFPPQCLDLVKTGEPASA